MKLKLKISAAVILLLFIANMVISYVHPIEFEDYKETISRWMGSTDYNMWERLGTIYISDVNMVDIIHEDYPTVCPEVTDDYSKYMAIDNNLVDMHIWVDVKNGPIIQTMKYTKHNNVGDYDMFTYYYINIGTWYIELPFYRIRGSRS